MEHGQPEDHYNQRLGTVKDVASGGTSRQINVKEWLTLLQVIIIL